MKLAKAKLSLLIIPFLPLAFLSTSCNKKVPPTPAPPLTTFDFHSNMSDDDLSEIAPKFPSTTSFSDAFDIAKSDVKYIVDDFIVAVNAYGFGLSDRELSLAHWNATVECLPDEDGVGYDLLLKAVFVNEAGEHIQVHPFKNVLAGSITLEWNDFDYEPTLKSGAVKICNIALSNQTWKYTMYRDDNFSDWNGTLYDPRYNEFDSRSWVFSNITA